MDGVGRSDLIATLSRVRARLLAQRNSAGHWEGELSSSALSTATAVFTLELASRSGGEGSLLSDVPNYQLIRRGLEWLARTQNDDGGWGDTIRSLSNISTTVLCWSAFAAGEIRFAQTVHRAEKWLSKAAGGLQAERLAAAIVARYGKDRTFSVPILTMAALAGRLGPRKYAWALVPQLPFELAACPHQWYAALRLPVVSYALPALIAIGQVRHHLRPSGNPVARIIRNLARLRTLRVLESIQPASGGFLEATPLTSFVTMSLIGAKAGEHPVV